MRQHLELTAPKNKRGEHTIITLSNISTGLTQILQSVHHVSEIKKGTFLYQEGLEATEVYIIQSGIIQVSKMVEDGRELTIRLCSAGDLVGELSLFQPTAKYMLNAKVMESGKVAVINKEELEQKLEENNELALEFMKWLNVQYRKSQSKVRDLVLNGKKGALYSTLIRLSNSYGVKNEQGIQINISLTNQELANFCGTSREVVNRMLSDLRKQDIISVKKGIISIHDIEYLKTEICCEDCPIDICNIN